MISQTPTALATPSAWASTRYPGFCFEITHRDSGSRARLGRLRTPHGDLSTPNFIFCGTKAAVKGVTADQLRALDVDIILSNTYHLMIQPGADTVARLGGLHRIMNWHGPMLTDSGGFQIFSMGHGGVADEIKGRARPEREASLVKISEEGASFRAYTDGRTINLRPEDSIDIQRKLGADFIVQLDECTPYHVDKDYTARSMAMSHRWGWRSLAEFDRGNDGRQAVYGIIQGGVYEDLRRESSEYTRDADFFGTAIGGSLGGSKAEMHAIVAMCMPFVHPNRPVHLLGIGGIQDIFNGVRHGVDTFDCVSPTRIARHGWALMKGAPKERINIRNARFRDDPDPLDDSTPSEASRLYAKGYLHHLFKAGETLGPQLLSQHNIAVMMRLLREIRSAVRAGTLDQCEREWLGDPAQQPETDAVPTLLGTDDGG